MTTITCRLRRVTSPRLGKSLDTSGAGELERGSKVPGRSQPTGGTGIYLTRFQTSSADPPPDAAAVFHFNSSPECVNGRFCSVPFQFGKELPSMWNVRLWSVSLIE